MPVNSSGEKQRTLLIVEDDQLTRSTLERLIAVKYPVLSITSAEDGCAGLASFREHRQDFVITDLCMPGMDGSQMAKEILCMEASTVIIAISAYSEKDRIAEAKKAGIAQVLNKPLEFKEFFAIIDSYLVVSAD